ncbi:MAG: acyltransferase [Pseudomonadota bacterium]
MRERWIDAMRLSAGVSMVGLHATSDASGQPFGAFDAAERVVPMLFRAVVYMARTELFIVVSLFLLMMALDRRPRGYVATVAEQARRLLIPFAFWVVFYAFFRLWKASFYGYEDAILAQLTDPLAWMGYFLLGDVSYHMHFLPTLFPLVLFVPLYRYAVRYPVLGLSILALLFLKRDLDVWLWSEHKDMAGFEYLIRSIKVLAYTGYGLIAASLYGLYRRGLSERADRLVLIGAALLWAAMSVIKFIHAFRIVEHGNWQFNYTPAYWADFLMPAVLFTLCYGLRKWNWPAFFTVCAPFSFGIYLMHPIFLDQFEMLTQDRGLSPSGIIVIKVTGTLLCTIVAVRWVSRTPAIAWTIGMGPLPRWMLLRRPVVTPGE